MKHTQVQAIVLSACLAVSLCNRAHARTANEQADAFHARGVAAEQRGELVAAGNCYTLTLRLNAGHRAAQARLAEVEKKMPAAMFKAMLSLSVRKGGLTTVPLSIALDDLRKKTLGIATTGWPVGFEIRDSSGALYNARLTIPATGTAETLESILNAFCEQAGAQYQLEGKTIVIFPKGLSQPEKKAPAATASASFVNSFERIEALNDGMAPNSSADTSIPRFTWYSHQGTFEWVQYEFAEPQAVEGCSVYWYHEGDKGGVRLPEFWRVLFLNEAGTWMPVENQPPPPTLNAWNTCRFKPVRTTALRVAAQLGNASAGFLEWKVIPSSVQKPLPLPYPNELRLDDLIPVTTKVGHGAYRVNRYASVKKERAPDVLIDGSPCAHFLFAHATSAVSFAVPSGYSRFTAIGVAPHGRGRSNASWTYQVLADGKPVYQSERLDTYPGGKVAIGVDLPPGTHSITLITDNAGSGNADHSIWAHPKLLRSAGGTTATYQAEAVRKYPPLGKSGSAFNLAFVAGVKRYQKEKPDFFKSAEWPMKLADEVAEELAKQSPPATRR